MANSTKRDQLLEAKLTWLKQLEAEINAQLANISPTTQNEQELRLTDALEREKGRIRHELRFFELALHPPRGRSKGDRNKWPKPLDPAISAALSGWEPLSLSNPKWSERQIARRLAFNHCPVKTNEARGKFADRLRSAKRNSKKP